jgi:hypothetical protein
MIDRCDADIADWSEAGDNFVIKNADKFSNVCTDHDSCRYFAIGPP